MLLKHLHLQPSEWERKPFYELEYLMENMKEDHDEQEKQRKADEERYTKDQSSITNMKKDFTKMTQGSKQSNNMPKFPDMSKFKM